MAPNEWATATEDCAWPAAARLAFVDQAEPTALEWARWASCSSSESRRGLLAHGSHQRRPIGGQVDETHSGSPGQTLTIPRAFSRIAMAPAFG